MRRHLPYTRAVARMSILFIASFLFWLTLFGAWVYAAIEAPTTTEELTNERK